MIKNTKGDIVPRSNSNVDRLSRASAMSDLATHKTSNAVGSIGGIMSDVTGFAAREDIRPVLTRIKIVHRNSTDPDGDGDKPISIGAMKSAVDLVLRTAKETYYKGVNWMPPSVSSTPNGEVSLTWRIGDNSINLIVSEPLNRIVCVTRSKEGKLNRQSLGLLQSVMELISFFKTPTS